MQSNVYQSLKTTDTSTFNFQNTDINRRLKLQIKTSSRTTSLTQHLQPSCEGRPSGIQGVVPFSVKEDLMCEGRPGGIHGVVPFSVKEDLVVSRVLFPSCEGRPARVLGAIVSLRGTVPLLVKC
ncbi:hypothetical protein Taro_016861 [Colocasia esculenta]|uniref:Uncharacterized protein n=1 Tax=Colocasia esculenta TaxID=4460 RepID=A0A843UXL3_COLES|nr:hypothetical protein [Colocasia esculenta]